MHGSVSGPPKTPGLLQATVVNVDFRTRRQSGHAVNPGQGKILK